MTDLKRYLTAGHIAKSGTKNILNHEVDRKSRYNDVITTNVLPEVG